MASTRGLVALILGRFFLILDLCRGERPPHGDDTKPHIVAAGRRFHSRRRHGRPIRFRHSPSFRERNVVLAVAFGLFAMAWVGRGDAKPAAAVALWFGFGKAVEYLLLAAIAGGS
jgi:hypothetical protein